MAELGRQDHYFKFIGLFLLFLLLAFDQDLAMIYFLIMVADYMWWGSDNFISFPISRGHWSNVRVYVESFIGLGVFLVVSSWLVRTSTQSVVPSGIVAGAQSILTLLASATPILQGSRFLTIIGWGILVPIIETVFWNGRLLEGFATYAEIVNGKTISVKTWSVGLAIVVVFVASLFTLFHITAKGLSSTPLLVTFLFSTISSILVIRHQELKGAILMHIVTNIAAVLSLPQATTS